MSAEVIHEARRPVLPEVEQGHTPVYAMRDFDGNVSTVRAHKVFGCVPDKNMCTFIVMVLVLLTAMGLGIALLILNPASSPEFQVGQGLVTFVVGVFVPSPKLKSKKNVPALPI